MTVRTRYCAVKHMPKRGDLSKERILDAALRLVDVGGTESLTMRRVADELGVSPMGLYRRVATRDEILDGLIDKALDALAVVPEPGAAWEVQLRSVFLSVHRTLLAHPGLIAILTSQSISTTRAMRAVEHMLAALRGAGFSPDAAIAAVAALQSYTFGFTVQQRARTDADQRSHLSSLRALPADDFPQIHALAADFSAWASDEHFQTGLDWLLHGISQSARE